MVLDTSKWVHIPKGTTNDAILGGSHGGIIAHDIHGGIIVEDLEGSPPKTRGVSMRISLKGSLITVSSYGRNVGRTRPQPNGS